MNAPLERSVLVRAGNARLEGDLALPDDAAGIVVFAHGSGSSRKSSRNRYVAEVLRAGRLGTLLFDLLTAEEEVIDARTRQLRFDIPMLARRLVAVTDRVGEWAEPSGLRIGLFGASTGAAAALIAAAHRVETVRAVVSRGGRPDLAGPALEAVRAPTLLIVGGRDLPVVDMNRDALRRLRCVKHIEIVPGATHLFEEAGTLARVAVLAREWFRAHLVGRVPRDPEAARGAGPTP
jgi:pimeloyl-ACP methyl ester carboxylesterase